MRSAHPPTASKPPANATQRPGVQLTGPGHGIPLPAPRCPPPDPLQLMDKQGVGIDMMDKPLACPHANTSHPCLPTATALTRFACLVILKIRKPNSPDFTLQGLKDSFAGGLRVGAMAKGFPTQPQLSLVLCHRAGSSPSGVGPSLLGRAHHAAGARSWIHEAAPHPLPVPLGWASASRGSHSSHCWPAQGRIGLQSRQASRQARITGGRIGPVCAEWVFWL